MEPLRLLTLSLVGLAVVVAGCTAPENPPPSPPAAPPSPPPAPPSPPPAAPPSSPPAPMGSALTRTDITALSAAFGDQPFQGGQGSPAHVSKWVSNTTWVGMHFDNDNVAQANKLLWIVVGQKGVFCKEAQPGGNNTAFTHFHKYNSSTWEGGHGGQARDQGYWLAHIAVDSFEAPWGLVTPGTDYAFMPTPAPACGANVPAVNFTAPGEGPLGPAEVATLVAVFDDQPFQGGQGSPEHVSKWVNEEVFVFQHWNHANPLQATQLLWYGVGLRGGFCASLQPEPKADFTHFHQGTASSWDAGHGGKARDQGYWLEHVAVASFDAPWGPVVPGVDKAFMPTPAPSSC